MALETLKGVTEIGGFKVVDANLERDAYDPCHGNNFVIVNHEDNSIEFKIQNGPIKEVGVNGCQVDTLIEAAKLILEGFNKKVPSDETSLIIAKLDEALMLSNKRKADREKRGVEGTGKL